MMPTSFMDGSSKRPHYVLSEKIQIYCSLDLDLFILSQKIVPEASYIT